MVMCMPVCVSSALESAHFQAAFMASIFCSTFCLHRPALQPDPAAAGQGVVVLVVYKQPGAATGKCMMRFHGHLLSCLAVVAACCAAGSSSLGVHMPGQLLLPHGKQPLRGLQYQSLPTHHTPAAMRPTHLQART